MTEELLNKIHGHAYWRVVIRPSDFSATRVPSLGRCEEIIRASQVVLRGWDYPHIDRIQAGDDWIDSACDWDGGPHYEYWRFHQSGQFVHHFNCVEEFHRLPRTPSPSRYLLVLNALYTVTEVFEFAARLARHDVLGRAVQIRIELHGMKDRELTFQDVFRAAVFGQFKPYVSGIDVVKYEAMTPVPTLLGTVQDAALDAAIAIFERFNWLSPSRPPLAEEQKKFVERRLGV